MYTFKELLEDLNKLTEEQLCKPVWIRREEENLAVAGLDLVEDDIYRHKDDDASDISGSLKELRDLEGDNFDESNYKMITPKGMPFLWEDF